MENKFTRYIDIYVMTTLHSTPLVTAHAFCRDRANICMNQTSSHEQLFKEDEIEKCKPINIYSSPIVYA